MNQPLVDRINSVLKTTINEELGYSYTFKDALFQLIKDNEIINDRMGTMLTVQNPNFTYDYDRYYHPCIPEKIDESDNKSFRVLSCIAINNRTTLNAINADYEIDAENMFKVRDICQNLLNYQKPNFWGYQVTEEVNPFADSDFKKYYRTCITHSNGYGKGPSGEFRVVFSPSTHDLFKDDVFLDSMFKNISAITKNSIERKDITYENLDEIGKIVQAIIY